MTIEMLLCDNLQELQRVYVVGIWAFQRIQEFNMKHILHHGSSQLLEEDFLKTRRIFSKHFEPHTPSGKTSHVALRSKTLQNQISDPDGSHFIHITMFLCSQLQIVVFIFSVLVSAQLSKFTEDVRKHHQVTLCLDTSP